MLSHPFFKFITSVSRDIPVRVWFGHSNEVFIICYISSLVSEIYEGPFN